MVRKLLLVVVLLLAFTAIVMPAAAATGGNVLNSTFTCVDVTVEYSDIFWDRNNYPDAAVQNPVLFPNGAEAYYLQITDGDGTDVFLTYGVNPFGGTTLSQVETYPYFLALPDYNPLRFRLVSAGWNGFEEQVIWDITGTCEGLPTFEEPPPPEPPPVPAVIPFTGPGLPSAFVHRRIDCDTPVYNLPGGQPVGNGRIINGQTWFVNPQPVEAPDGSSWTEIFVSSRPNPYIPTACVNPDPSVIVYKPNLPR